MTTQKKQKGKLVPKLRFKGFDGDWERRTFFDISENVSYGMNAAATEFDGKHKYIRITDIDIESGEYKPNPLTSPDGKIEDKYRLKNNDIVFARTGASVGKSYLYNPKDGELYYAGFLIKFSVTKASAYFVYSLTLKEAYNKWVHIYSMRSGQPGLNAEEYKALKINLPTLPEQQKISSFLSSVDEKLSQLTRKKELLALYKKGVMQQLFSGSLRFKDENGKEFPKWEEKRLDEVANFRRGSFPQPYGLAKWFDEINGLPFVQVYDVDDNMLLKPITKTRISKLAADQSVFVKEGTLVITIQGSIGRIAKTQYDTYVDRTLLIFQSYKEAIDVDYFKYVVSLLFEIEKTKAPGGTIKTITKEALSSFKIMLPQIEEQKKIADYFSSIDTKIQSINTQISQTQSFKKGLLQQMFV